MRIPAKPRKLGDLLRWAQEMHEFIMRSRIVPSPDVKPIESTRGTALITTAKGKGGDGDNVWQ